MNTTKSDTQPLTRPVDSTPAPLTMGAIRDLLALLHMTDQDAGGRLSGADFIDRVSVWVDTNGLQEEAEATLAELILEGTLCAKYVASTPGPVAPAEGSGQG